MSRSLSVAVKEFIDAVAYKKEYQAPPLVNHSFIITKYPYEHKRKMSRMYKYSVKDGFELWMNTPYDIDLMGNPQMREDIRNVLKGLTVPPDHDQLNKFKQIVVHHKTYTGVFDMACGTEEKVIEVTLME